MKWLPGGLLFILGILLIYNIFSESPIHTSWSMLFSIGGIFMLIGLIQYARGKRLLVATAFFIYGLLIFLDDFYSFGDFIYVNFDIDIPSFNNFLFPFFIIIIGLYLLPTIQNKNKRVNVFSKNYDRFEVRKSDINIEGLPNVSNDDKNLIEKKTIQETKVLKTKNFDFKVSEKFFLTICKKKIVSEIEYQRGYKGQAIISKLDLDFSSFKSIETNRFNAIILGYLCKIIIRVPRNVIVINKTNSVLSSVVDNRSLLPTQNTTKKCIEIEGKIVCCNIIIEESEYIKK